MNWEEEEGFGVDPYNSPLFVRYSCDSTFRSECMYLVYDETLATYSNIYVMFMCKLST